MPQKRTSSARVVCFGEVLWDVLPRGIFLGGAPLNVAYHLSRLGVSALPLSAVGRDFLGREAVRRITSWGVDTRFIAETGRRLTGTVRATLDDQGAARFLIARDVAWDRIPVAGPLWRGPGPRAIVFGTLALREAYNRRTLQRLFEAWPRALRVLDLNLRPPFVATSVLAFALRHAQVLKLNDEELASLSRRGAITTPDRIGDAARWVAQRHAIPRVCVTAGARGAGLWSGDRWLWKPGRPVTVRDTIGAGDAFLAGLLSMLLATGSTLDAALDRACRLGEFVAARDGATPPYTIDAKGCPRDVR